MTETIYTATGILYLDTTSDPCQSIGWVHREEDGALDTPETVSTAIALAPARRDQIISETADALDHLRSLFDPERTRAINDLAADLSWAR